MTDTSVFEHVAPRLFRAHRERMAEIQRRRPCGREGFCCACYLREQLESSDVAYTRHEPTPWLYERSSARWSTRPYTLWQYHHGFRTRVYDWELEHVV